MALAVEAEHRKQGIGSALMQTAEQWLAGRGARAIVLGSGNHRSEAHQFYEQLGYQATGKRFKKSLGIQGG